MQTFLVRTSITFAFYYKSKYDETPLINWIRTVFADKNIRIDRVRRWDRGNAILFISSTMAVGLSGAPGHPEWTKPLRIGTNGWKERAVEKKKEVAREVDCWLVEKLMGRVSGWTDWGCEDFKGQRREFWSKRRYWIASFK